jgi:hypothetical protein
MTAPSIPVHELGTAMAEGFTTFTSARRLPPRLPSVRVQGRLGISIPVSGSEARLSSVVGSPRLALNERQVVIVSPKAALPAVGSMTIPQNHDLAGGRITHRPLSSFEQNHHRCVSLADDTATL